MADVNANDRAQIVLITALVVAVIFVALAVVVNSAIYTENLSTRDSGAESRGVLEQRATNDLSVFRAVQRANAEHPNTDDVSVIESELEGLLDSQSAAVFLDNARYGKVVDLGLSATTEGSHLRQVDETRNFTAGGDNAGTPDWTLVEDAKEDGTFRFGVRKDDLLDASSDSVDHILADTDDMILGGLLFHEAFHVEVTTEGGDTWRTFMFQAPAIDGGRVYVYTEGPDEEIRTFDGTLETLAGESCAAPVEDGLAEIDFSTAEAGGEPCEELTFYQDEVVGGNHTISIRNARTDGLTDAELESLADAIEENDSEMYDELESTLESLLDLADLGGTVSDGLKEVVEDAGFTGGDRGTGTYDVVVDVPAEEANFSDSGGPDPTRRVIVFSADVDMTYRTGGAHLHSTEVEIRWNGAHS